MSAFTLTIAGEAAPTHRSLDVVNPATGKPFASCPDATRAQLDEAMAAADDAYRSWRTDEAARRQALLDCGAALQAAAPEIGRILTQEQGKPLEAAIGEVAGAGAWFQLTSGLPLEHEVLQPRVVGRRLGRERPHLGPQLGPLALGRRRRQHRDQRRLSRRASSGR